MDTVTDYSLLPWGSNRIVEALTWRWGGLLPLSLQGLFPRQRCLLRLYFASSSWLISWPSLASSSLSDSTPTLVFLGFLPLTYLGVGFSPSFSTSCQNKPRGPLLFQVFCYTLQVQTGEQGSRWRYKQLREKAQSVWCLCLAPGFCFSLVISESMKPSDWFFSRLPFLRSQKGSSSSTLPLCSLEGMNMDRKSDRCVSMSAISLNTEVNPM